MDSGVLGAVVAKSMGDVDAAGVAPVMTTKKKDETKGMRRKEIARAFCMCAENAVVCVLCETNCERKGRGGRWKYV